MSNSVAYHGEYWKELLLLLILTDVRSYDNLSLSSVVIMI